MNDAQVQAQSCATPANDESVGVARTNAMLKQGDTFCVFELGSVPEGTKLYTHPPKQEQTVFEQLKAQMKNDAGYAWSWHCNIAMAIYDANLASHTIANLCAAQVMRILFDIEPAHDLPKQSPIDERAEFEKITKISGVSVRNDTARDADGDYYSLPVQYAWCGWQARAKLSAPVVPDGFAMVPTRLTAENGAKVALSGEFYELVTRQCLECVEDESGDNCEYCENTGEVTEKIAISWDSIKAIHCKVVELFSRNEMLKGAK